MIRVFDANFTMHDRAAVARMMDEGFIGPGKRTAAFEAELAKVTGVEHAIACNSGTTALMLSLMAVGVRPGGVVVCPAYGFHAAANAARMLGAHVWLIDVRSPDFLMDVEQLWKNDPSPVQAIVLINQNGHSINHGVFRLMDFSKQFHIPIVEDACQSLGMKKAEELNLYTTGVIATLSFSVPKLITTGQGGAMLTNNAGLAAELRGLTDHGGGWRETRIHQHVGGNFRMPDLCSGLGLSQLERLDEIAARREAIHKIYRERLEVGPEILNCGWCVTYRTPAAKRLISDLHGAGIEALQPYHPTHHHRPFVTGESFPEAELAAKELVYLPGHVGLTDQQVHQVCDVVRRNG